MSTNLDIFDTFIAAKQALDELPRVRDELATARSDMAASEELLNDQATELAKARDEMARLKATLADKEVALAAATFRESEATRKIDSLRDILGAGVVSHRDPSPEPVAEEAKPEPLPEPEAKPEETHAETEPLPSIPAPAPEVAEPIKQYAGKAHWERPFNVTWAEWVNGGGEPSPWSKDAANF